MARRHERDQLEDYARFAARLARLAGEAALPWFRRPLAVEDKGGAQGFDPVTEADRAAERAMREAIEEAYPDHGITGEEYGETSSRSGFRWVLDPIDGTRAFIAGLPSWGTLVALNDGERPVVGVVAQPYIGEVFTGISDGRFRRADLNGRPITTRRMPALEQAILSTTGLDFLDEDEKAAFLRVARAVRLTRYGFDCYAYAVLALGFIDLVIEAGLKPHDIQALIPLIEGAGGVVTGWEGTDAQQGGRVIAAGDPDLHERARAILQI
ncbi:MAG: histidinol-phosphatase [Rhodothalassiaceae bacterium]